MKSITQVLLIILVVHAIDAEIPQDIYNKYNQSYNQWQNVKTLWNNSYQYTLVTSSWSGHSDRMTIFILNGEVVGREYTHFFQGQQREHWLESKDQLYSHGRNSDAIKTGTLDNIYSTCLQSLNVSTVNNRETYHLVFQVDTENHGVLKSCGNIPNNCADDCFFGVTIDVLKSYQQQQPRSSTVSMTSTTNNLITDGKTPQV